MCVLHCLMSFCFSKEKKKATRETFDMLLLAQNMAYYLMTLIKQKPHCIVIIGENVLSLLHSDIMEWQVCIFFSSEGPVHCKGSVNVDLVKDLTRANRRLGK